MSENNELVKVSIEDGVATVMLNRPEVMNAINLPLRERLMETFAEVDANRDVRVVVITGAGDRAFCVGADLKERQDKTIPDLVHHRRHVNPRWVSAVAGMTKPTIAAINGYCLAGGFELMLQCDMAIASDKSVFGMPEVSLGFIPAAGACQRLPRIVGISKAKELILTARRFDAAEALSLGLVMKVVTPDAVMTECMKLARQIARHPPVAVVQAKLAISTSQETLLAGGLKFESEAWLGCLLSEKWLDQVSEFNARKSDGK